MFLMPARPEMPLKLRDPMFIIEELAALATGVAAAIAAFATIVPGFRARWAMLAAVTPHSLVGESWTGLPS